MTRDSGTHSLKHTHTHTHEQTYTHMRAPKCAADKTRQQGWTHLRLCIRPCFCASFFSIFFDCNIATRYLDAHNLLRGQIEEIPCLLSLPSLSLLSGGARLTTRHISRHIDSRQMIVKDDITMAMPSCQNFIGGIMSGKISKSSHLNQSTSFY